MFQARILTASPKTVLRLKTDDDGICFDTHSATHSLTISNLNADVNAPKYAIIPEDVSTSPVNVS